MRHGVQHDRLGGGRASRRYGRIVSDALVVSLARDAEATWVRVDSQPALRSLRPAVDSRLAVLLATLREIAAAPLAHLSSNFRIGGRTA